MSLRGKARGLLRFCVLGIIGVAVLAARAPEAVAQGTVRVVGVVRDETNAIALPGVPVEVAELKEVAYTDVDLSTELEALEKLCRAIHEQGFELGTGSRLLPQSQVKRGIKREFISRSYNLFVKCVLFTHF